MTTQKNETLLVVTLEDVKRHNKVGDLWLALDGLIYDLSHYDHPGGLSILLEHAGRDATNEFERQNHSDDAYVVLKTFLIAKLKSSSAR
jgi:cytochrome b5